MTKLLVFDWDGTLSNSLARIAQCLQCAAVDNNLPPPSEQQARDIVGLGLTEALGALFPEVQDTQLLAKLCTSYSKHFIAKDEEPSPFYPHVMERLTAFHNDGYLLAVATGKSRRGLDRVLRKKGLQDFFHATRCADETQSKPHPRMLQELTRHFSLEPEQAVMVGDTEFDMDMALRAGVPGLAVTYGAHEVERLRHFQPFACVDCFSQVEEAILNRQKSAV